MKEGISEEDAEVLLRNHMSIAENAVYKRFVQDLGISLNQGQFDALVSFTYNLGSAWMYDDDGTLVKAILRGTVGSELIRAFSLWCNAGGSILPGLVRRRLSEANMYLNGEYSINPPSNYGYVYYNANGGDVIFRIQGYDANEGTAPAYTPNYGDRTFQGWYTSQTGGEKITVLTMDLSGETLYARWDQGTGGEGEEETQPETKPVTAIKVKVTADDVNLRKGPGTNYTIVGTANIGDELTITEIAEGSGYLWGKDGDRWIALMYTNYEEELKKQQENTPDETEPEETVPETTVPEETEPETTIPEETEPENKPVTGKVKADGGLALREGPGTGYGVIRYLEDGSKVTIIQQKKVGSMTWGYTGEGWVSMTYVVLDETPEETEPEPTVPEETEPETTVPEVTGMIGIVKADGGLLVRSGPDTSYDCVWFLEDGTEVTITEIKTTNGRDWGKISHGWICMDYVVVNTVAIEEVTVRRDPAMEPESEEETVEDADDQKENGLTGIVMSDDGLSVRKGAGTSYPIKEYLGAGASVTIFEVEDVSGTKWGYTGSGWVCMDYVALDGEDQEDTKTIIAESLNVREEPSAKATIINYYFYGARVEILETAETDGVTWGRTSKGWICMDYVA